MAARKTTVKKTPVKKTVAKNSSVKRSTPQVSIETAALNNTASSSIKVPSNISSILKNKKISIALAIGIIAVALFLLRGVFIAATVNGQPISRLSVIRELEKQGGKQIIQSLVTKTLIMQEANRRGVGLTDDDINNDLKKIEDSYKAQGQTLDQVLKTYNVTKQDVIEQRKPWILLSKMIGNSVKVSDKEVDDFIAANNEAYGGTLKKEEVKKDLEQQKLKQKESEFVENLQKQAKIDYLINY